MTYRYLEEEATADVAFEATGESLSEVFHAAADAVVNVMVGNPHEIEPREAREVVLTDDHLDLLLLNFLQEFVYFKDARQFLARPSAVKVEEAEGRWSLHALVEGEPMDLQRHQMLVDVKAVTLHQFRLEQVDGKWRAHVILDI